MVGDNLEQAIQLEKYKSEYQNKEEQYYGKLRSYTASIFNDFEKQFKKELDCRALYQTDKSDKPNQIIIKYSTDRKELNVTFNLEIDSIGFSVIIENHEKETIYNVKLSVMENIPEIQSLETYDSSVFLDKEINHYKRKIEKLDLLLEERIDNHRFFVVNEQPVIERLGDGSFNMDASEKTFDSYLELLDHLILRFYSESI